MAQYIPVILFTVLTNALAQILLKRGMLSVGVLATEASSLADGLVRTVLNPWVFAGLCTFVVSMLSHLFVLSRVELSYAYPFLSLAYVVTAAYAWWAFSEDINGFRVAGIALICCGTVLISRS